MSPAATSGFSHSRPHWRWHCETRVAEAGLRADSRAVKPRAQMKDWEESEPQLGQATKRDANLASDALWLHSSAR